MSRREFPKKKPESSSTGIFDIFIMSTERFEESKNVIGGIAFPANKYGQVIYEAA